MSIVSVNVSTSLIGEPFRAKREDFIIVEDEVAFGRLGGFRGVQEKAEREKKIAVVGITKIDKNMPRFKRPGSPYTRIAGIATANLQRENPDDPRTILEIIVDNINDRANGVPEYLVGRL